MGKTEEKLKAQRSTMRAHKKPTPFRTNIHCRLLVNIFITIKRVGWNLGFRLKSTL